MSWVGNVPSLTLKGISRSLRRRGKQVREILESSILPADSGILNAPALTKQHTGTYLTCFRRLWWCYQICNSTRWGRNTISHSQTAWMSRLRFFSSRKNEGLEGTDDGNSCKSNPRVVVCTHLYALSIGNSVGCNEGLLRWKIVKGHIVLQRYQHLRCDAGAIQMAVSTVSNSLPLTTETFLVCRSLISIHGSVRITMRSGWYQLFSTWLCKIARQHSNTANWQNPNQVYFTLHFVSTYSWRLNP